MGNSSTRSPDYPVCHCLGVTEREIRQVIAEIEPCTIRQVAHACGAGGGCTACHRHIKRYLHEAAQQRSVEQQSPQFVLEAVLGCA